MIIKARGIKAWLIILGIFLIVIILLILLFQLLLFLLPLILIMIIISYLFKMLNKVKKEGNKDYIDIKFKVKNNKNKK